MSVKEEILARVTELKLLLAGTEFDLDDLTIWEMQIRLSTYEDVLELMRRSK